MKLYLALEQVRKVINNRSLYKRIFHLINVLDLFKRYDQDINQSGRNSKNSSLERKFTKEINIKEIREEDFEQTGEADETENKPQNDNKNISHYIGDGNNQNSSYNDQPLSIDQLYHNSVSYLNSNILL